MSIFTKFKTNKITINSRNGQYKKTVKSSVYQPNIENYQRDISNLKDIYRVDVSLESISRITGKLIPLIQE